MRVIHNIIHYIRINDVYIMQSFAVCAIDGALKRRQRRTQTLDSAPLERGECHINQKSEF